MSGRRTFWDRARRVLRFLALMRDPEPTGYRTPGELEAAARQRQQSAQIAKSQIGRLWLP